MRVKGGFIEDVADDIEGWPGAGEYWKSGGEAVGADRAHGGDTTPPAAAARGRDPVGGRRSQRKRGREMVEDKLCERWKSDGKTWAIMQTLMSSIDNWKNRQAGSCPVRNSELVHVTTFSFWAPNRIYFSAPPTFTLGTHASQFSLFDIFSHFTSGLNKDSF